jgi:hypothetical protein
MADQQQQLTFRDHEDAANVALLDDFQAKYSEVEVPGSWELLYEKR